MAIKIIAWTVSIGLAIFFIFGDVPGITESLGETIEAIKTGASSLAERVRISI